MKAKITITRDIKEIPDLIVDSVNRAKQKLEAVSQFKFNYLDPADLAQQISAQRLEMSDIDDMLEDAQTLATGYVNALNPQSEEPEEPEHEGV